ncbi:hypothetical protein [Petrachloros mirabilis]
MHRSKSVNSLEIHTFDFGIALAQRIGRGDYVTFLQRQHGDI